MLSSIWKRWMVEIPSIHPLILQLFLSLVLVFTLSRVLRGWRPDGFPIGHTFEWTALCWSTLLLTTAIGNPLGAGTIALVLEAWRRKSTHRFCPLDTTVATWAIILGLLIAEKQYQVALVGTLIPAAAFWIFGHMAPDKSQADQYLVRLIMDTNQQNPDMLLRRIQETAPTAVQPVYQTENGTLRTYALACQSERNQLEAFIQRLRGEIPGIQLDLQSVKWAPQLNGGTP